MNYIVDRMGCECAECEKRRREDLRGCIGCLGVIVFLVAFYWGSAVLGRWVWLNWLAPLFNR